jgi:choline-sulfatase
MRGQSSPRASARQLLACAVCAGCLPALAYLAQGRWSWPLFGELLLLEALPFSLFIALLLFGLRAAFPRLPWPLGLLVGGLAAAALVAGPALARRPLYPDVARHAGGQAVAPARAPGVLLITVDTLRADALGCYGQPLAYTPGIDALARRGRQYAQALSPIPVTSAAHASILCGAYPRIHGSRANADPIRPGAALLAPLLNFAGRRPGNQAVVSAFPVVSSVSGLDEGFSLYDQQLYPDRLDPRFYGSAVGRWLGLFGVTEAGERKGQRTNLVAVEAARTSTAGLLWVHYYDPHLPYDPPPPYDRLFPPQQGPSASVAAVAALNEGGAKDPLLLARFSALYAGEVAFADRCLRELLRAFAAAGHAGPVLTVLVADHGESLTEHGYYFSHGRELYESSLAVPLLVAGEGIAAGELDGAPFALPGLARLILAAVGLPAPAGEAGLDERGLLAGPARPADAAAAEPEIDGPALFAESGERVSIRPEEAGPEFIRQKTWAIRTARYKYIRRPEGTARPREELYDLLADPAESLDLAVVRPEIAQRLAARLLAYVAEEPGGPGMGSTKEREEVEERLKALGYVQ